jgi:hypothetical protein
MVGCRVVGKVNYMVLHLQRSLPNAWIRCAGGDVVVEDEPLSRQ